MMGIWTALILRVIYSCNRVDKQKIMDGIWWGSSFLWIFLVFYFLEKMVVMVVGGEFIQQSAALEECGRSWIVIIEVARPRLKYLSSFVINNSSSLIHSTYLQQGGWVNREYGIRLTGRHPWQLTEVLTEIKSTFGSIDGPNTTHENLLLPLNVEEAAPFYQNEISCPCCAQDSMIDRNWNDISSILLGSRVKMILRLQLFDPTNKLAS